MVLDTLRGLPERLKRPESLLMLLMMFASIGVHMPPYLGLGALADYFEEQDKLKKKEELPPVSFEVNTDPKMIPEPPKPEPERPKTKKEKREEEKQKQLAEKEKEKEKPKPDLTIQDKSQPQPQPPPPPPEPARKQSITQKSDDPDVEPPPDAKYMAEESRRVLEESIASVTSESKDDPKPQASAPQAAEPEHAGDSRQQERGAIKGAQEEQEQRTASSQRNPSQQPPPSGEPSPSQQRTPAQAAPDEEVEETIIRDPLGTFVLRSQPHSHDHGPAGQAGPQGAGGKQPNIKVSWRAFEDTFGAEQLAQDRLPREAKRRGAGREKRWEEFRAAIENYVEGVKPGNTTALNAAADPFAAYLAAFHRNLHAEFAYEFVASLPMSGELGNPMLVAKVEIVINPDGSLDRVGVVKSSGNLMYDFGAFNAVQRGSPYPPTPEKIRSPDGRVYMRWALHRDQNMCGTWLAEPYILKNPPRSPNDPKQDNISPFLPGRGGQRAPAQNEEHGSNPGKGPAVAPGETLSMRRRRILDRG